jgi:flagellar basal body-associated protein FliL
LEPEKMKKLFIVAIITVIVIQLSACTIKPIPLTQATPFEPTIVPAAITPPGVISTNSITPNSTSSTSPKYQQTPAPTQTTSPIPNLTVEEVKQKMDSGSIFVLMDVRSKADYDKSHIVGAVSIPIEDLSRRYTEISQESEIIIYGACT